MLLILSSLICACASRPVEGPRPSALAFLSLAEADIRNADYPAALLHLDSALAINPRLANLYLLKGVVLENMGETDAAITAYEHFLSYRREQPHIWKTIALLHEKAERYEQATVLLKRFLQALPDSVQVLLDLSRIHYKMGEYATVLNYLKDYSNAVNPPESAYWLWKGQTNFRQGRYDTAIASLSRYLAEKENDTAARKIYAFAIFESGQTEEALSILNSFPDEAREDAEIYLYRGKYFIQRQKPEAARTQLMRAVEINPAFAEGWFELARLSFEAGEMDNSQQFLETLLHLEPEYWPAYRYLGFIAENRAQPEAAKKYYQQYLNNTTMDDSEVTVRMRALKDRLGK